MIGTKCIATTLLIIVALAQYSESYTYITTKAISKLHPGKCYTKYTKSAYSPSESFQRTDICEVFTCRTDQRFSVAGCGTIDVDAPNCREVEPDLTLPYPRCCKRFLCTDENGKETYLEA